MWMKRVYALMGLLAWFIAVDCVEAGHLQKGQGLLTSVEKSAEEGTVIVYVDEHGYRLDAKAEILDRERKPVRLQEILPRTSIFFRYNYTTKGPVIRSIQVLPLETLE